MSVKLLIWIYIFKSVNKKIIFVRFLKDFIVVDIKFLCLIKDLILFCILLFVKGDRIELYV